MTSQTLATTLKALHVPSSPLILANIWDVASLNNLLSLNSENAKPVKAVATASWAIAATLGIKDEELSPEQNLEAITKIGAVTQKAGIPLSTDLQDGYGDQIETVVTAAIMAGSVGANIEDVRSIFGQPAGSVPESLYPLEEQVERLKAARRAAEMAGCPDFVINARCDVMRPQHMAGVSDEDKFKEAIARGKAYIDAGATTVFYWGKPRGLRNAEVETLVRELKGKVAVSLGYGPSALTTTELAEIGVSRISVGPRIFLVAMEAAKKAAMGILGI